MIYITGDTHGNHDVDKLTVKKFPIQKDLTRDDYVIICGDFGCVWNGDKEDTYWLNWFEDKNFTTLFVDGNHENFDILNKYPLEQWQGGKIHKIMPHVYHLMRGQVFELEGRKIFTLGGGTSADKVYRTEGKSWWKEEEISDNDIQEALKNLRTASNKVDYVITHTVSEIFKKEVLSKLITLIPKELQSKLISFITVESPTEKFLDYVKTEVEYKYWINGHIHLDRNFLSNRQYCLYNRIIRLDEKLTIINDI